MGSAAPPIKIFVIEPAGAHGIHGEKRVVSSAVKLLVKWRRARLPGSSAKLTAFADDLINKIRGQEKTRAEASEVGERLDGAASPRLMHGHPSAAVLPDALEQGARD